MRHYEIVFLINPDQSEQVVEMIDRYVDVVQQGNGALHRREDWGRRQLAYPIENLHKAHYILLNIECTQATLDTLTEMFRFNDAILRHLILHKKSAITTPSIMMKKEERV